MNCSQCNESTMKKLAQRYQTYLWCNVQLNKKTMFIENTTWWKKPVTASRSVTPTSTDPGLNGRSASWPHVVGRFHKSTKTRPAGGEASMAESACILTAGLRWNCLGPFVAVLVHGCDGDVFFDFLLSGRRTSPPSGGGGDFLCGRFRLMANTWNSVESVLWTVYILFMHLLNYILNVFHVFTCVYEVVPIEIAGTMQWIQQTWGRSRLFQVCRSRGARRQIIWLQISGMKTTWRHRTGGELRLVSSSVLLC